MNSETNRNPNQGENMTATNTNPSPRINNLFTVSTLDGEVLYAAHLEQDAVEFCAGFLAEGSGVISDIAIIINCASWSRTISKDYRTGNLIQLSAAWN